MSLQNFNNSLNTLIQTIKSIDEPSASDNMIHNYMMQKQSAKHNQESQAVLENIQSAFSTMDTSIQNNSSLDNINNVISKLNSMETSFKTGYKQYFDNDSPIWDTFENKKNQVLDLQSNIKSANTAKDITEDIRDKYSSIFESAFDEGADYDSVFMGPSDDLKDVWTLAEANDLNVEEIKNNKVYKDYIEQELESLGGVMSQLKTFAKQIDSDHETTGIQISDKYKDNEHMKLLLNMIDSGALSETELIQTKDGNVVKVPQFSANMTKYLDLMINNTASIDRALNIKNARIDDALRLKIHGNFKTSLKNRPFLASESNNLRGAFYDIMTYGNQNPNSGIFITEILEGVPTNIGLNINNPQLGIILEKNGLDKNDMGIMNLIQSGMSYGLQDFTSAWDNSNPMSINHMLSVESSANVEDIWNKAVKTSALLAEDGELSYQGLSNKYSEYIDENDDKKFIGKTGFFGGGDDTWAYPQEQANFIEPSAVSIGTSLDTKEGITNQWKKDDVDFRAFAKDFADRIGGDYGAAITKALKDNPSSTQNLYNIVNDVVQASANDNTLGQQMHLGSGAYGFSRNVFGGDADAGGIGGLIGSGGSVKNMNLFYRDYVVNKIAAHAELYRLLQIATQNPQYSSAVSIQEDREKVVQNEQVNEDGYDYDYE